MMSITILKLGGRLISLLALMMTARTPKTWEVQITLLRIMIFLSAFGTGCHRRRLLQRKIDAQSKYASYLKRGRQWMKVLPLTRIGCMKTCALFTLGCCEIFQVIISNLTRSTTRWCCNWREGRNRRLVVRRCGGSRRKHGRMSAP